VFRSSKTCRLLLRSGELDVTVDDRAAENSKCTLDETAGAYTAHQRV
jgi:hypothetical protein